MDILCLGIFVADMVVKPIENMPGKGKLALVDTMELHTDGCASNTDYALSKLGISTGLMGNVSLDGFGDFFVNYMYMGNNQTNENNSNRISVPKEDMWVDISALQLEEKYTKEYSDILDKLAARFAKNERRDLITTSDVKKAAESLNEVKRKHHIWDIFFGGGGILLGVSIRHILDLVNQENINVQPVTLVLGIIGGILLGLGIMGKVKN